MTAEPTGVLVRQATSADVPAMAEIRVGDAEVGPADTRMAAYLDGVHHPQRALKPRVAFLAEVSGTIVGYIADHLTDRFGCDAEVQYLYVAPPFRRAGVAGTLLRHLAAWFVKRGAVFVCVDVNSDSASAEPFYSSLGATWLRPSWMAWQDIRAMLAVDRGDSLDSGRAL
jgi:GNAT superfamily N-acetyltransferase